MANRGSSAYGLPRTKAMSLPERTIVLRVRKRPFLLPGTAIGAVAQPVLLRFLLCIRGDGIAIGIGEGTNDRHHPALERRVRRFQAGTGRSTRGIACGTRWLQLEKQRGKACGTQEREGKMAHTSDPYLTQTGAGSGRRSRRTCAGHQVRR